MIIVQAAVLVFVFHLLAETGAAAAVLGDVNGDGTTDICDATAVQRYLAEYEPLRGTPLAAADVDGDGSITVADVTALQRSIAGFDNCFDPVVIIDDGSRTVYYSSLALAAADANLLSTGNSDLLTPSGAACGMYIEDDTAHIFLTSDSTNTPGLSFVKNTVIDMCGKALSFSCGSGITYDCDLAISGGSISGAMQDCFLVQANNYSPRTLALEDMQLDVTIDNNSSLTRQYALEAKNGSISMTGCTMHTEVINNNSASIMISVMTEPGVAAAITDSSFDVSSADAVGGYCCLLLGGESRVSNVDISGCVATDYFIKGLHLSKDQTLELSHSTIDLKTSTAENGYVYVHGISLGANATLISEMNSISLDHSVAEERTDADYYHTIACVYASNSAAVNSTSDTLRSTAGSVCNNIIHNYGMLINYVPAVSIDNINAAVTSTIPSYNPASDGVGHGINGYNSNFILTENNGSNYIHGSHSAMLFSGSTDVEIYGGTFESPAHGGIYYCGEEGNRLEIHGGSFINTRGMGADGSEPFADTPEVGCQGAFYFCSRGATGTIANAYIYGGRQGLRVKRDRSFDGVCGALSIESSYICGNWYAVAIDTEQTDGAFTIGSGTILEHGDGRSLSINGETRTPAIFHFLHGNPVIIDNRDG